MTTDTPAERALARIIAHAKDADLHAARYGLNSMVPAELIRQALEAEGVEWR